MDILGEHVDSQWQMGEWKMSAHMVDQVSKSAVS